MNAKEMFEQLGYVHSIGEFTIIYIKKFDDGSYHNITFDVLSKVYTTDWYCCNKVFAITVELHKAIYQQCKELGWLDE